MEPSAELKYLGFSALKRGKITLRNTKNIISVHVTVTEPLLKLTLAEYELTPDEIAAGEFIIPDLNSNDFYLDHIQEYMKANASPEVLVLNVTIRYATAEGEKTLEYSVESTAEQGWGVKYFPEDEPAGDGVYPGHFYFFTYDSMVPISLAYDAPEQAVTGPEKTVLSVEITIEGRQIAAKECQIKEVAVPDPIAVMNGVENPTVYYSADLLVKRPDWAPEHGTCHVTVVQQLSDGDSWTTEENLGY